MQHASKESRSPAPALCCTRRPRCDRAWNASKWALPTQGENSSFVVLHPALTPCLHSNRLRREHIWMPSSCNNSRQVQRRSPSLRPVNLLLLLLLSLLIGVPSLDAQTTGTIEGHVLDVRTSQPISGVRASIALGANYSQINRMV